MYYMRWIFRSQKEVDAFIDETYRKYTDDKVQDYVKNHLQYIFDKYKGKMSFPCMLIHDNEYSDDLYANSVHGDGDIVFLSDFENK